jgi:PAS domain S-box-containing protein
MDHPPEKEFRRTLDAFQLRAEALQVRLDGVQGILDAISEAILIQDAEGCFLDVNEGAARMYGYPRDSFLGKTSKVLSVPGRSDLGAAAQAFDQALGGEPQQIEFWGQKADGTVFPQDIRLYPGTFMGQKVVISIAQEITERKRAEQIRDAANRISEAALGAGDLAALYRSVHDILRSLIPAENCYIALHDAKTNTLDWPYWVDQMDEVPASRPFGRGLTEYVIRSGRSQLLEGSRLAALAETGEAKGMGAEAMAWMGVPLRNDRRVYGALVIQSYEGGYRYRPEDLEILSFVSAQIAMAIDRKAAEASLRFSEDKFSRAFHASPDAINLTRLDDGTYLEVSEGFEKLTGWTRAESIGRTTLGMDLWVNPSDRHRIVDLIREHGEYTGLEIPFRRKDGTILTGLMSGKILEVGGVPCLLSVTRDISDRKAAESTLRATEQRLRTVMANSQAVIYQLDPEGRFMLSEGLGLAPMGLKPGQVVGLNALDVYRDDLELTRQIRQALKGEASRMITRAAGRLFDNLLTPVLDTHGRLESVIGIATDVTERQQMEEDLRAERGLFVGGPVMVLRWRAMPPNWLVDYVSANIRTILGYAPEDLTSGRIVFNSLVHPEDRERVQQEAKQLKSKGVLHYEQEYRMRMASGEYRWFHDFTAPATPDPEPPYYLGYMLDITDRRRAEDALRQAQKLESLGILAGGIAHDFNNLLTVVLGNLNLAQMHLGENAKAQPYLTNMETTVLRATELTKQMLAYSGRGHFLVKPQDINAVVREVTHLLEVSISKKIQLKFDLESDLPALLADAAQIQQVVMNLVTNASDAIGDQEGIIHISTSKEVLGERELQSDYRGESLNPGPFIMLEVADTGIGMGPEVMARIFDPFFTTKATGRGLGLSAMLGILRGHGAGLRISSAMGLGSAFRICFPVSSQAVFVPASGTEEAVSGQLRGRILLVDDEDLILQAIGSALQTLGLEVLTARDGLEALERFREAQPRPDLVLMDLTMPRMDGREAFRAMHDLDPSVPIVLSSGFTEQDSVQTMSGENPAAFIQKPYQIKELRQLLQRVLGS